MNFAKFKERVRQDAVKAGLDVHSIHKQPKMVDYVTDPAKQIAGYKGALLTQEQVDEGVAHKKEDPGAVQVFAEIMKKSMPHFERDHAKPSFWKVTTTKIPGLQ